MSELLRVGTITPGRPDDNFPIHLALRSGRERVQIKRWWNSGSNHKNYIDCSAAKLEDRITGCEYLLVWPHNFDSRLDIEWVAKSGFIKFKMFRAVKHVALLCMDGSVLIHWIFGNRPGQKPKPIIISEGCADGCTPGSGGGPGGICRDDTDCPPGFICQNGICMPPDPWHCWTIPELPTIDTDEARAPRSTSLFTKCVDIPKLPDLQ